MKYDLNKKLSPFMNIINRNEIFVNITDDILPGVYPYYMVSNYGRVYHKFMNIFLKPGWGTSGYLFVYLSTNQGPKNFLLHRLVMIAFSCVYNYQELQVNHIDGNKHCNSINNLEWVTRSENIIHSYKTGLHPTKSKIDEETARYICELLSSNNYTIEQISDITKVNYYIISDIKKGSFWRNLSSQYNFISRPGKLFSDDELRKICEYFQNNPINQNERVNDLCRRALYNCGFEGSDRKVDSIRKLYTRKNFNHISKHYKY